MTKLQTFFYITILSLFSSSTHAGEPCAVLEDYLGDVEILNSSRTELTRQKMKSEIQCGSFISVGKGWAKVKMIHSQWIHLGSDTFIQLKRDFESTINPELILFKGTLYVKSENEDPNFRIISPTTVGILRKGEMVMRFHPESGLSELVCLKNQAILQNRFESKSQMQVRAGEKTELNDKLDRVTPELPTSVSLSSLRPILAELQVSQRSLNESSKAMLERQSHPIRRSEKRKVYSERGHYLRNETHDFSPEQKKKWIGKVVGDETIGEQVLYPDKFYGKGREVVVEVQDFEPSSSGGSGVTANENQEKMRLIQELNQIRIH